MAKPKKATLHQVLVPMVDSVDFASVESAITASDFNSGATVKFYGLNTGGSAATTSGTVSKIASLVRSGVFRVTLKGTENNYDMMMLRVNKTGCAEQIMTWENVDNDDSDMMSALLVIQSMASDAHSAAAQGNSRILVNTSLTSDIQSYLVAMSGMLSDVQSAVLITQSAASDTLSRCVVIASMASDAASAAQQANSRILVNTSLTSDIYSQLSDFRSDLGSFLTTTGVQLNASMLSDLRSAITGVTATVSASDMSDIASRVDVLLASRLSDILSAAQQGNSRVLVVQSMTSDVYSLVSNINSIAAASPTQSDIASAVAVELASRLSDIQSAIAAVTVTLSASDISDIASAVAAAVTFTVSASDMSDIASRVDAVLASRLSDILSAAQQGNSRVLVVQSMVSDTQSKLSDVESNLLSVLGTTGVQLNASSLSDLRSAITAGGGAATISASDISDIASAVRAILVSDLSDILSAAQQVNSRALVAQSYLSDIRSHVSDLQSDFQSRVPKLVANNSQLSQLASDVLSALAAGVPVSASDMSDLRSAIAAGNLTASDISDIASAVAVKLASDLSDIYSAAAQTNSRVLLNQSRISDIYSLLSDVSSDLGVMSGVQSDLYSAVQAGVEIGASSLSDIRSAITANGVLKTGTEPTTVIGHSDTLAAKVDWLTALTRNTITQTATVQSLRNDANSADIASAAVSDDGTTFTRGEWS